MRHIIVSYYNYNGITLVNVSSLNSPHKNLTNEFKQTVGKKIIKIGLYHNTRTPIKTHVLLLRALLEYLMYFFMVLSEIFLLPALNVPLSMLNVYFPALRWDLAIPSVIIFITSSLVAYFCAAETSHTGMIQTVSTNIKTINTHIFIKAFLVFFFIDPSFLLCSAHMLLRRLADTLPPKRTCSLSLRYRGSRIYDRTCPHPPHNMSSRTR